MPKSFFLKNWEIKTPETWSQNLAKIFLSAREVENLNELCADQIENLQNPDDLRGANEACEIILRKIKTGEKIVIFGDFDLDGISSSAILFQTLQKIGANVAVILPTRRDGFGLSTKFVDEIIAQKFQLFISCDCGVSNFNEIAKLNSAGITTIITDHHSIDTEKIPAADAILHPHFCENEKLKNLTGAGVALKLSQKILQKIFGEKFNENEKFAAKIFKESPRRFFEKMTALAALGTVADVGGLRDENRVICKIGLREIRKNENLALAALAQTAKISPEEIDAEKIAFFLAPRLNAAGRLSHPQIALELLLGKIENAKILEDLNLRRREMCERAMREILPNLNLKNRATIAFRENLNPGIIGLISGQLCDRFARPTIVATKIGKKIVGSCRSCENFNFERALRNFKKYFIKAGGHAQAAGFSIRPENFMKFARGFEKFVREKYSKVDFTPSLKIDAEINLEILDFKNVENLMNFGPFGAGFAPPLFCATSPPISNLKKVGQNLEHLQMKVGKFSAICFRGAEMEKFFEKNKNFKIAFSPEISTFLNEKRVQLKVVDVLPI